MPKYSSSYCRYNVIVVQGRVTYMNLGVNRSAILSAASSLLAV